MLKQITLVDTDPGDLNDKMQECAVVKSLRHSYICRQKDYFANNKMLGILSEYCDKGDLDKYLKNQGGCDLTETRVKKFILEILLGLDYLHTHEIIHRDLKPSNIFLKGKDYTVQIGDFGIACMNGKGQTRVEDVGTLLYQSPEIVTGGEEPGGGGAAQGHGTGYDHRTDIWSLGCIILQLCNFDVPFSAFSEQRLVQKIKYMNHRQMDIRKSQEFKDLYEICMNKDYTTRPTARDLLNLDML